MRKSGSVGGVSQPVRVHGSSIGGAAAASSSRFSLYGQTSASKRSMTPSGGAAAKQMRTGARGYSTADVTKEPRPSTKAFKDQSIRELADFLVANNYPHPLTLKQLNQPSSSDFRKIFEFLVSSMKPGFKLGPKLEEEIPALLKLYGYPFTIPKSHFQTIGVPHTWPTLLNVLTWFRINILATSNSEFQQVLLAPSDDDNGIVGQKKMLWDYTNETYDMYMGGADEFDDALENLEKRLATNSRIDEEIEALTRERDKNKKILDELTSQPDELSKLQTHLDSIQIESEKFERYQVTMEAHLKDLSTQLQRLSVEDAEQSAKLEAMEAEKQSRSSVLVGQNNAGVNFPHLMNKLSTLRRRLPVIEKENQDIDAEIQRNELELEQDKEQVEMLVKEYNRIRRELIPDRDDLNLKPEMTEGERLRIQDIRFKWREMRVKLNERLEKLEEELLKEKSQEENWEEVIQDGERMKASLVNTAAQLHEQIREKKEGHQRKMEELQSQVEARQGRCDLQRSDVLNAKKRLDEEEAALRAMKTRCEVEEEEFATFVKEVIHFLLEHKKKVQSTIREGLEEAKKCRNNLHDGD